MCCGTRVRVYVVQACCFCVGVWCVCYASVQVRCVVCVCSCVCRACYGAKVCASECDVACGVRCARRVVQVRVRYVCVVACGACIRAVRVRCRASGFENRAKAHVCVGTNASLVVVGNLKRSGNLPRRGPREYLEGGHGTSLERRHGGGS